MVFKKLLDVYYQARFNALAFCDIGRESVINYRRIVGKKGVSLNVGASSIVEASIIFDKEDSAVSIGDRTFIGASLIACAEKVEIGNDVLISWGCSIVDHNSHALDWSSRKNDVIAWRQGKKDWTNVKVKPVKISDRAWVGFNSIILKGVTIGEGAIIGAGSLVAKDVAPYTIVAGNPARFIREVSLDER
jgi:galactoside O-acetyltransferase